MKGCQLLSYVAAMGFKFLVDAINKGRFTIAVKAARNRIFYKIFQYRGRVAGRSFAKELQDIGTTRVCFTIAFNTPWVIDALTKAWETYRPGMDLVVIDNSTKDDARAQIARICAIRKVPYFGLPNRREKHWSRSHGTAITWTFHNVVSHLRPELFGFIDHDCFPVFAFSIPDSLAGKAVYGLVVRPTENFIYKSRKDDHQWNLWAGFCFYRFAAVDGLKLNFEPRMDIGLDTGGANWPILYSKLGEASIEVARREQEPIELSGTLGLHELLDGAFLHIGGSAYADKDTKYYRSFDHRKNLRNYIWDTYLGGSSGQIADDF
ncbi:hypothetical protein P9228_25965 [Mesorhizobium sp. WSM4898]|uniref:hypothetical protein n=1 Tax=Mesorhizobium sp. WSM4898 TaxID=3038544 RepID=UPI002414F35F|nr:hypothetical protein [Mesorhizobium sp. WSM4898]MDG4909838.1 hypothetical protein [Mesorhizobium sp. WSM4898]